MSDMGGEHVITVSGPQTLITQNDLVARVIEVLSAPDTVTVTIPEDLWHPLVRLIRPTVEHLGMIPNTYEEEWIEGRDDVERFGRACAAVVGADPRLDSTLVALSTLAERQARAGLPIVIDT